MQNFAVIARIQELCNARGWTYYRLAKESGITYSTLTCGWIVLKKMWHL